MTDDKQPTNSTNEISGWVKNIVLLGVAGVFCVKVYQTPIKLIFDFPSFLALLLALFSVGLAAMFYFKATESSSTFYDNTYKFTKDIAELLVKIESGFGEKLQNLDEHYKGMSDRFDNFQPQLQTAEVQEKVDEKEAEKDKIETEKDKIIEDLITKAKLNEGQSKEFKHQLHDKEVSLQEANTELRRLERRLRVARNSSELNELSHFNQMNRTVNSTLSFLVKQLGDGFIAFSEIEEIQNKFASIINKISIHQYTQMKEMGFISNGTLRPEVIKQLRLFISERTQRDNPID